MRKYVKYRAYFKVPLSEKSFWWQKRIGVVENTPGILGHIFQQNHDMLDAVEVKVETYPLN